MSTVNSTSAADPYANINGTAATGKKSEIEEAQDRFLKLLVTQLQTQDPLNPLDNEAVTSQMAQISTVQGIEKLNKNHGRHGYDVCHCTIALCREYGWAFGLGGWFWFDFG